MHIAGRMGGRAEGAESQERWLSETNRKTE